MMDERKRLYIMISLVMGIILAVVILLVLLRGKSTPLPVGPPLDPVTGEPVPSAAVREPEETILLPVSEAPSNPGEVYVRQLAGIFVERFGSFSNQNDNSHIVDAEAMATQKMSKWLRTQALIQEQEYVGQTTKVVAGSVISYSDQNAEVLVDVQVLPSGGTASYRSGRVELTKIADDWKVDGLYWGE